MKPTQAQKVQPRIHGINLAGSAPSEAAKVSKIQSIVKQTSFIVLGVYFVAFLAIVGINFFFLSQEKKYISEGANLKKQIAGLSSVETLLTAVKSRTTVASNLLTSTPSAPERLLSEIISFLPPSSSISEVNTQEGKFTISVVLPNSQSVSQLFTAVSASQFTNIFLDGLSKTTRGVYTVTLSVQ